MSGCGQASNRGLDLRHERGGRLVLSLSYLVSCLLDLSEDRFHRRVCIPRQQRRLERPQGPQHVPASLDGRKRGLRRVEVHAIDQRSRIVQHSLEESLIRGRGGDPALQIVKREQQITLRRALVLHVFHQPAQQDAH